MISPSTSTSSDGNKNSIDRGANNLNLAPPVKTQKQGPEDLTLTMIDSKKYSRLFKGGSIIEK